jgi:TolB-like protein
MAGSGPLAHPLDMARPAHPPVQLHRIHLPAFSSFASGVKVAEFYSATVRQSDRFRGPLCLRDSQSLEFDENDQYAAEVVDEIRKAFETSLGRIAGARLITQAGAARELPDLLGDHYVVDAVVERSGDRLRVHVDLRDGGSNSIPDKYQYNIGVHTLVRLADRLEVDLIPALRSRIALDQPSE